MTEENKLVLTDDAPDKETAELLPKRGAAEAQAEIQAAIIVALKFPRNEDAAYQKLLAACRRPSFAREAFYRFPRGKGDDQVMVEGPSVNLAREAARVYRHMRWGIAVLSETKEERQIEGWAYDLENNNKVSQQDQFSKIVYRRSEGWIPANERELRELTGRRGAILYRNCLLQLLPRDWVEYAINLAKQTLRDDAAKDPEAERKRIILAFSNLNVSVEALEQFLGHKVAECSPAELVDLRAVYKSIADGATTWSDHVRAKKEGAANNGEAAKPKRAKSGNRSDTQARAAASEPPASAQTEGTKTDAPPRNDLITKEQVKLFWAVVRKQGWAEDEVRTVLKTLGIEHVHSMSKAQLDEALRCFAHMKAKAERDAGVDERRDFEDLDRHEEF
jgi:hypothetical protein